MSIKLSLAPLPPEILFNIIDQLIPSSPYDPIALPPWHLTTKTLLAFTLASRTTYRAATHLLYTHCLYIDSPKRLRLLCRTLCGPLSTASEISLTDFAEDQPLSPSRGNTQHSRSHPDTPTSSAASTRPRFSNAAHHAHIHSLYLRLFKSSSLQTPNEEPIAATLHNLTSLLGTTLKRLVVEISPEVYLPTRDGPTGPSPFRAAVSQLTNLETLCSVRDDFYLDSDIFMLHDASWKQAVWQPWKMLRTLVVSDAHLFTSLFWDSLLLTERVETVVMTRCIGLDMSDVKALSKKFHDKRAKGECDAKRRLTIIFVDTERGHQENGPSQDKELDEKEFGILARQINVPTSYYGDEDEAFLCHEWVKRRMMQGEDPLLWT